MNLLVITHDLTTRNAHLMPWRTVCEVVARAREKGHGARLVSLAGASADVVGKDIPPGTVAVPKAPGLMENALESVISNEHYDVVLWPVVWREPYWRIKAVTRLGVPVAGYFPGGAYRFSDVMYAVKRIGLRKALPYLADAVWPKRMQLDRWRKCGLRHLIAMTSFTAHQAIAGGWPENRVSVIPPGREKVVNDRFCGVLPDAFSAWRKDRPFYMFAGPPSGIRGVYELLDAFEQVAERREDACLVCLFRSDAPLEADKIAAIINRMRHRGRIYTVWESLGKVELEAFMAECAGIVLPFVAVPSEIPLAIIEAMKFGKPVITTMTGGTGQFVEGFGASVKLGDVSALSECMIRLLSDKEYYLARCGATRAAYQQHPDWDDMVGQWIESLAGVSVE